MGPSDDETLLEDLGGVPTAATRREHCVADVSADRVKEVVQPVPNRRSPNDAILDDCDQEGSGYPWTG